MSNDGISIPGLAYGETRHLNLYSDTCLKFVFRSQTDVPSKALRPEPLHCLTVLMEGKSHMALG